jgi:hypothetical protein
VPVRSLGLKALGSTAGSAPGRCCTQSLTRGVSVDRNGGPVWNGPRDYSDRIAIIG